MKKKSDIDQIYQRLTQIAPKAGSTLRTVEAYTAIKTLRWVLECDSTENNLEEMLDCLESEPVNR